MLSVSSRSQCIEIGIPYAWKDCVYIETGPSVKLFLSSCRWSWPAWCHSGWGRSPCQYGSANKSPWWWWWDDRLCWTPVRRNHKRYVEITILYILYIKLYSCYFDNYKDVQGILRELDLDTLVLFYTCLTVSGVLFNQRKICGLDIQ